MFEQTRHPSGRLVLTQARFESLQVNYLTIPVYVMACIILGFVTYISDRLNKRAVVAVFVPFVVIAGYAIAIGTSVPGAGFFAMFLCSGGVSFPTPATRCMLIARPSIHIQHSPSSLGIK